MTEKADTNAKQGLHSKVRDLGGAVRDIGGAALRETLGWSAYQWTVLALLTAIFLLVALSYGGIRAELAALKENGGGAVAPGPAEADLSKRMSDLESSLGQALTDIKSGLAADLAAIGAKLDALGRAPKQAAPAAPKPAPKPKPQ